MSGDLYVQTWDNLDCSGIPINDTMCYDCETNDAGEEQCSPCKGSCDDTTGATCNLL